jgi:amino acid transporter
MQDSDQEVKVKLSRELGLLDITMIGIAGMIGAGVFALTGIAAGLAGPALILAFFFNGIIATITASAYAELSSAIPGAGGGYVWIREAFGHSYSFLAGWVDWFAHSVACALYAVTFGAFFAEIFVGIVPIPRIILVKFSTFVAISILIYINYKGVKETARVGSFITLSKVSILLLFIAFGVYRTISRPNWVGAFEDPSFFPTGITGVLAAMGLTYIAFEGYEIIVQSGEEAKNPNRNIPRAIFVSLWVAVVIYILVAFSVLGSVVTSMPTWEYLGGLAELGLIRTANQIMPFGTAILLFAGLVSTASAMNATIYSSSRVSFALARDGLLDKRLSKLHETNKTPYYSIFFTYIIIAFMALALPIEAIAASTDIMFILLFIQVNMALIMLRYKAPNVKRVFKVPLVPYVPLTAIILQVLIAYFLIKELEHGMLALSACIGWLALGSIVYVSYSKEKRKEKLGEEFKTVFQEKALEEKHYKIMVSVANPATAENLVSLASTIAKAKDGEIVILSIMKLPAQTPLSAGEKYVEKRRELLKKLKVPEEIPVNKVLKISHNIPDAILNTIEEEKPDMLIIGFRGRTYKRDYILGSTIDQLLFKAPCDVAVVRFEQGFKVSNIKRILVPTAGGPHIYTANRIAKDLCKTLNSTVCYLHVASIDADKNKIYANLEKLKQSQGIEEDIIVEFTKNKIRALVERAKEYDLIIIGASNQPFIKNFVKGAFPERFIKRTNKTVIMVRKKVEIKELLPLLGRK